jgi:hypothetical protein
VRSLLRDAIGALLVTGTVFAINTLRAAVRAVRADEALIEAIATGRAVPITQIRERELTRLLRAWHADVDLPTSDGATS